MKKVPVHLGERSYQIQIGTGLLERIGPWCVKLGLTGRCAIITDGHVAPRYAPAVTRSLARAGIQPTTVTIPTGEKAKSLRVVAQCYDALAAHRLERQSFVVALGGGVVGDLSGFVAATYLRGIPFVQIPTTLLAQVDSSVGGKTGVNLRAGKNLVGSFHQPRLVLCDLGTLATLHPREFRAGLAEIIKYGIIQDPALFRLLERQMPRVLARDPAILTRIIARSCAIKAEIVGQDETESGLRATLNFGHTIGHAIEATTGYGRFLHGEAIAIGQVLAAQLSSQLKGLPTGEVDRIRSLFQAAGLPVAIHVSGSLRQRLLEAMRHDKKVSGGEVKFVLARRIGKVEWGCRVPMDLIKQALGAH
jgi:3-dehydroquinate synthase